MRETLPLLTTDMAEKTVQNEEEGWRDEGHEYIGQPVLRSFKEQGVETWSTGKITRWLPPTEEEPETVFHVVHDDDGDEEDLDQAEADEARKQYDEKTAGGVEALTALQAQPVYENSYERLKKDRITASWLGVAGARGDLLELEEALQSALNRKWDADARSTWLLSARNSESVAELGALALSLEEAVKGLQTVAGEAHERKP